MDEYCGSVIWDYNITQSEIPNFTSCFRNTILIWIPCIFLWIFLPLEIHYARISKARDVPFNFTIILKMILTIMIITINMNDSIRAVTGHKPSIYLHNAVLKCATFTLYLILTLYNLKKGIRSSGILFCFSLLSVICAIPQVFYIMMPISLYREIDVHPFEYMIYFSSVFLILGMNCFSDPKPQYSLCTKDDALCPAHGASFISKLYLIWFSHYISQNNQKPVEENLWYLDLEHTAIYLMKQIENNLNDFFTRIKNTALNPNLKKPSVLTLMMKTHAFEYFKIILWRTLNSILNLSYPVILNVIIYCLKEGKPSWTLYMCAFSFIFINAINTITAVKTFTAFSELTIKIRSVLMSMIYEKILRVCDRTRCKYTTGEIVGLITVDVQNVADITRYISYYWMVPFQLSLSFFYLWQIFGSGLVVAMIGLILTVPLSNYFTRVMKKLSYQEQTHKNERRKFLQDLLAGIKMLKMYAWETSFLNKSSFLRFEEYKNYKKIGMVHVLFTIVFNCIPNLMSCVTFITYIYFTDNSIGIEQPFVSILVFNAMKAPLSLLSSVSRDIIQGYISSEKIDQFLYLQELHENTVSHDVSDDALIIKHGTFSWISPQGEPVLREINLKIPKGSMVCVVGPVGAGKSSLISAFFGELYKINGYVNVNGKTSFVPQQSWILNTSFKENIILGGNFDESKYRKILYACALNADVCTFPAGDMTEIGEKGINLSGGQKQRINLARAIYCDSDIYFFDDVLSEVDFHVSKHIFNEVLSFNGILKDKTRIIVTHNTSFLPPSNHIVFMKNGFIVESGTFEEIIKKGEYFSEFMINYSQATENIQTDYEDSTVQKCDAEKNNKINLKARDEKYNSKKEQLSTNGGKLIIKEHLENGKVKKDVYKFFMKNIGNKCIVTSVLFNSLALLFWVFSRIWLMVWSSSNLENHKLKSQIYFLGGFFVLGCLEALTSFFSFFFLMNGIYKASNLIYNELVNAVVRWPLWLLNSTPKGRITNRAIADSYMLDDTTSKTLLMLLESCNKFLVAILCSVYASPLTAVFFISAYLVMSIFQNWYGKLAFQLQRINANNKSPLSSYVIETLEGLHSIRANKYHDLFISRCKEKIDLFSSCTMGLEINQRWISVRAEFIVGILISVVTFCILQQRNNLGIGLVCLSLSFIAGISVDFTWFFIHMVRFENSLVSAERIKQFIEAPKENMENQQTGIHLQEWPTNGEIQFVNYKLRYHNQTELVLKGLTFSVKSGEKIGIIGRTGAGKSSMITGMLRLEEPDGGSILIDNVDITQIDLEILRSRLTLIPQDPVLFHETLRFNLDPQEIYSDEHLWNALEKSHLKTFVQQLSQGLEYAVEEGGGNFSCGQRQLLCLARALLRKTKILLLDEATASVDLETDELIQNTIRHEFADCTVLTIAHRLNTVQDYDRILVLQNGVIMEYDTPSNLMKSKNLFFVT